MVSTLVNDKDTQSDRKLHGLVRTLAKGIGYNDHFPILAGPVMNDLLIGAKVDIVDP